MYKWVTGELIRSMYPILMNCALAMLMTTGNTGHSDDLVDSNDADDSDESGNSGNSDDSYNSDCNIF